MVTGRFIELHGELAEARAELRMSIRTCRGSFTARGALDAAVIIAHLKRIQSASQAVHSASLALDRYVASQSK